MSPGENTDFWSVVGPRIAADSRRLHLEGPLWVAHQPEFRAAIGARGATFSRASSELHLALPTPSAPPSEGPCTPEVDPAGACLPRVELDHGEIQERWASRTNGMEQGFEVARGGASIAVTIRTDWLVSGTSERLRIRANGGMVWTVAGLAAVDATGRTLDARFVPRGWSFVIAVDTHAAVIPVSIDPVYSVDLFTVVGEETGDDFTTALSAGGDVNGDGYPDLLVGHPNESVGRHSRCGGAWLYPGSALGLDPDVNREFVPGEGEAHYGASVAIVPDINADGYDDILIGSPTMVGGNGALRQRSRRGRGSLGRSPRLPRSSPAPPEPSCRPR